MAEPAQQPFISFAEYLAKERASDTKHEYLDGRIHDMAGGTPDHGLIAANVIGELRTQLRGRGCRVYTSDVRIRVQATGLSTYPDLSLVCGPMKTDPEDDNAVVNPVVLVEVLSPSSEAHDRGEKFAHYRRIPSLREYALISHQARRIEVFCRGDDGIWALHEVQGEGTVDLVSIAAALSVDEVYSGAFESAG